MDVEEFWVEFIKYFYFYDVQIWENCIKQKFEIKVILFLSIGHYLKFISREKSNQLSIVFIFSVLIA